MGTPGILPIRVKGSYSRTLYTMMSGPSDHEGNFDLSMVLLAFRLVGMYSHLSNVPYSNTVISRN